MKACHAHALVGSLPARPMCMRPACSFSICDLVPLCPCARVPVCPCARVPVCHRTSTQWPSGLTVAHTWDEDLFLEWGTAMGKEFYGKGGLSRTPPRTARRCVGRCAALPRLGCQLLGAHLVRTCRGRPGVLRPNTLTITRRLSPVARCRVPVGLLALLRLVKPTCNLDQASIWPGYQTAAGALSISGRWLHGTRSVPPLRFTGRGLAAHFSARAPRTQTLCVGPPLRPCTAVARILFWGTRLCSRLSAASRVRAWLPTRSTTSTTTRKGSTVRPHA